MACLYDKGVFYRAAVIPWLHHGLQDVARFTGWGDGEPSWFVAAPWERRVFSPRRGRRLVAHGAAVGKDRPPSLFELARAAGGIRRGVRPRTCHAGCRPGGGGGPLPVTAADAAGNGCWRGQDAHATAGGTPALRRRERAPARPKRQLRHGPRGPRLAVPPRCAPDTTPFRLSAVFRQDVRVLLASEKRPLCSRWCDPSGCAMACLYGKDIFL